jgi:hypothetical protein
MKKTAQHRAFKNKINKKNKKNKQNNNYPFR